MRIVLVTVALWGLAACTLTATYPNPALEPPETVTIYDAGHRDVLVAIHNVLSQSPLVSDIKAVETPGLGYVFDLKQTVVRIAIRPVSATDAWGRTIVGYAVDLHMEGTVISLTPVHAMAGRLDALWAIQTQIGNALASHEIDVSDIRYADL